LRKKKKNKPWSGGSLVAAAEHKGKKVSAEGTLDHFEKMLEGPCLNHAYPIKHACKDCGLMKKFLAKPIGHLDILTGFHHQRSNLLLGC
jgi:hypothetical protein